MRRAALLVGALTLVVEAAPARAQATVIVAGQVVDRAGAPVAGAVITVGAELVATDDAGAFTVTLPAGRYTLEVSAPWLVTLRQPLIVGAGPAAPLVLVVDVATETGGEQIEVVDIAPAAPGETRVDARLARVVPGGGDAAKVVQSLPSVARPAAGSAAIVVWGAAPRDTRVFVDGVPVPALYHLGGYRAAVGNDLVGDIRLTPAAFGPARGRAIGGVIDVGTADPADAPRWRAQADVLDGSLAGRTALGPLTLAAAVRTSWLDRAIDLVADPATLAPNAPLPRWTDAQVMARARVGERAVISGWVLGSLDQLARTLRSSDPATSVREDVDQRWLRAQVTLRRDHDAGFEAATIWLGRDRSEDAFRFGLTPARLGDARWVGGARGVQQRRLAPAATLTVGLDVDAERAALTRTGSLAIPAREGDPRIFGQPPGDDVAADAWTATTIDAAGHGALDVRAGRVTAMLGARVDAWLLGASRLTPRVGSTPGIGAQQITRTADPRVAVELRLTEGARLRVDAGRYHQARDARDTSAVFGTPTLGLERAWHVTAGAQWRRAPLALEAIAYARWMDQLVARDLAVTPPLAATLTQAGAGRVLGVQLTARVVGAHGITGWLSYMLGRSTRTDAAGGRARLFDHDQTHGLIAVASWERGPWTVGGRVRLATGEPRTGVVGALFDARTGRYQPIRGAHNGERLPAFVAADVRVERRVARPGARATVYVEVQNLTGRANAEERIYSANFSERGYLTGLPLLAIAGVRVER